MVFTLFEGRHTMPPNEGALCSDFDFSTKTAVRAEGWEKALNFFSINFKDALASKEDVNEDLAIVVTGLTPALTEFISVCVKRQYHRGLTLLHYNRDTDSYWQQKVLSSTFE